MQADRETTRIVRSWLEDGRTTLPDHVLDAVLDQLPAIGQRRSWWPSRSPVLSRPSAGLALGIAAIATVVVVGISLLPAGGGPSTGVGRPSAAPSPSASSDSSPSPSPDGDVWPTGSLEAQTYDARLGGISFSFSLPSADWSSSRFRGMLETGSYPTPSYAWIGLGGGIDAVATDPCNGVSRAVGPSLADQAAAVTTIPGTDASGPTDISVAGRPAKLVELTIRPDIGCRPSAFWLFGTSSAYPNSLDSTIRIRLVQVAGRTFLVYSDQAGPNPVLRRDIERIVDSIRFE